jgi:hypothetical protein
MMRLLFEIRRIHRFLTDSLMENRPVQRAQQIASGCIGLALALNSLTIYLTAAALLQLPVDSNWKFGAAIPAGILGSALIYWLETQAHVPVGCVERVSVKRICIVIVWMTTVCLFAAIWMYSSLGRIASPARADGVPWTTGTFGVVEREGPMRHSSMAGVMLGVVRVLGGPRLALGSAVGAKHGTARVHG